MKTIRKRYEELETELSNTYFTLKENKEGYVFLTEEDIENGDFDDYFEVRNDITGNTYDVHIIKVDVNGIKIVESEDNSKIYYIGFEDLATIIDRINLIELMQLCEDKHQ
jgi:hypothetical protein